MRQCGLVFAPVMFALVLVAASASSAKGITCIAKPNGQAPQGQHWYYRTDHVTNHRCWFLGPQSADVQRNAAEQPSDARTRAASAQHTKRPKAIAPLVAQAASSAEPHVPAPAGPVLAEAATLPDLPPSFAPALQPSLAEASTSADAIGLVLPTATGDAGEPQSRVNAQTSHVAVATQAAIERLSSLLVVTLVLLAMVGPVFHGARWLRQRKVKVQQGLSDSESEARRIPPPKSFEQAEKEVALVLRQLLNDTQTKSNVELFNQTEQLAQELQKRRAERNDDEARQQSGVM
jgi:hypothetical protein